jgi:RimJ/RimL family protein N-acetyltransferase
MTTPNYCTTGTGIHLTRITDAPTIVSAWLRICRGLAPLEIAFGPEGRDPRPRPQDTYYLAWQNLTAPFTAGSEIPGWWCGDGALGLVYTQRPAPTTRAFGMGLFLEHRGCGLGALVRDAAYALCFSEAEVWKLESEVYSGNGHSLGALHGGHARAKPEGCQRATICVNGTYYDRLLFGLTRPEWEAARG